MMDGLSYPMGSGLAYTILSLKKKVTQIKLDPIPFVRA